LNRVPLAVFKTKEFPPRTRKKKRNKTMKAKFKFSPGQLVRADNDFAGHVKKCAVSAEGNEYLLANPYHEQWTPEENLKPVGPAPQAEAND
jgi:hypothetical protein